MCIGDHELFHYVSPMGGLNFKGCDVGYGVDGAEMSENILQKCLKKWIWMQFSHSSRTTVAFAIYITVLSTWKVRFNIRIVLLYRVKSFVNILLPLFFAYVMKTI